MKSAASDGIAFDDPITLLHAPVGVQGSGAARYAAAMHFFADGLMPVEMLEIYRRCSKFDYENPIDLARYEGVDVPIVSECSSGDNKA